MTTIEIRRITTGPALLVEDAEQLALDFFRSDPSSKRGGYDDLAGRELPQGVLDRLEGVAVTDLPADAHACGREAGEARIEP